MRDEQPEDKKKEIKRMVDEIYNPAYIDMIYGFVKRLYAENKKQGSVPLLLLFRKTIHELPKKFLVFF